VPAAGSIQNKNPTISLFQREMVGFFILNGKYFLRSKRRNSIDDKTLYIIEELYFNKKSKYFAMI